MKIVLLNTFNELQGNSEDNLIKSQNTHTHTHTHTCTYICIYKTPKVKTTKVIIKSGTLANKMFSTANNKKQDANLWDGRKYI